jgi:hypothetical protein
MKLGTLFGSEAMDNLRQPSVRTGAYRIGVPSHLNKVGRVPR